MEALKVVEALARRGKQNRRTGHAANGQCGTTARIAVQLGQDDAREADAVTEGCGGGDCVLTDHGVEDEHDLVGVDGVADGDRLLHHLLVDTETAGRIDDDHVDTALAGKLDAAARDLDGVADAVSGLGCPHLDAGALTDNLELLDGVGALEVGGDEQDGLALLAQPLTQLSGERGLTGTLEAGEHEDGGAGLCEGQLTRGATEDLNEFLMHDGDDLLARVKRLGASCAVRLFANLRGELANDGKRNVRVDEGATNVGNRVIDVRLGQDAAAAQATERLAQTI